jgi:hypothetical protein
VIENALTNAWIVGMVVEDASGTAGAVLVHGVATNALGEVVVV